MKVIFHERYKEVYASDPAAAWGRLDLMIEELRKHYTFIEPLPAGEEDLLLVHTQRHINSVKQHKLTYDIAILSAGGAIKSSEVAMQGEKAFGLIRPPGHHASPDSCWGFCWFNNVAIAVEKLRRAKKIKRSMIIDIDLHYGDGTANIFATIPEVTYHHVTGRTRQEFLDDLESFLATQKECDLIAISAGFDRHEADWGGLLKTDDYATAGKIIVDFAGKDTAIFALLEGGYNQEILGESAFALLSGLGE